MVAIVVVLYIYACVCAYAPRRGTAWEEKEEPIGRQRKKERNKERKRSSERSHRLVVLCIRVFVVVVVLLYSGISHAMQCKRKNTDRQQTRIETLLIISLLITN